MNTTEDLKFFKNLNEIANKELFYKSIYFCQIIYLVLPLQMLNRAKLNIATQT